MTPTASSLFPAAPLLNSATCGLDTAAGPPSSLFTTAPPLGSTVGGLDAAAGTLSSPFDELATTGAPSFLAPPLIVRLSNAAAGASFHVALPPMAAAPTARSALFWPPWAGRPPPRVGTPPPLVL
ncbi:hypothetical protein GUJ93_ZPchr0002g24100 [Zizania palustris]|uniref:Uncharacterized protein n=1 Tax=Zizania palustris TaxID=103762 RepID=A0A8J5SS22_ZIZPA|nr:hypothetical protein GUJ93_ZPchr0002g24100 [Zizania palustris]